MSGSFRGPGEDPSWRRVDVERALDDCAPFLKDFDPPSRAPSRCRSGIIKGTRLCRRPFIGTGSRRPGVHRPPSDVIMSLAATGVCWTCFRRGAMTVCDFASLAQHDASDNL